MCQHAQLTNKAVKAIGFKLEDEDASELDHEDFMRGVIAKFGPRCFFCNLEGHFKSDCLDRNSGMQWQTSSIQGMKKLCQE